MNNAYLYIRARCNAKQGESKLLELAAITADTGIVFVDGDDIVEYDRNEEGKCLGDMKEAVKSGTYNIVIVDRLESISEDRAKAEKFLTFLMGLGAIVLIVKENDLVLFRGGKKKSL